MERKGRWKTKEKFRKQKACKREGGNKKGQKPKFIKKVRVAKATENKLYI